MHISQNATYQNDHYKVVVRYPSAKEAQPLLDFVRGVYRRLGDVPEGDKAALVEASVPDCEELERACEVISPFLVEFTTASGEAVDREELSLSEGAFLQAVTVAMYADCFQQSEIKKK